MKPFLGERNVFFFFLGGGGGGGFGVIKEPSLILAFGAWLVYRRASLRDRVACC